MIIEVGGTQYKGWTSATANIRLDALSNAFSFSVTAAKGKALPFKGGEECSILVDGEKVITGHIELVNIDMDATSHNIDITGRDNTGDVIDSKIGSVSDIRPPITLKRIIELLLKDIDSPVTVSETFTPEPFKKIEDLAAGEPGQDVWEFIESLARKRQVLLTSDADGNIVIARSTGEEVEATLHHRIADNTNNVLSASISYDMTGRYNKYLIVTQLNPIAIVGAASTSNSAIVNQTSDAIFDSAIQIGRQYVLLSENSGASPKDRAIWEANIRKARGRVYSCSVSGYRNQTGDLWRVNTVIRVDDEQADIESRMLINSVQFSIDTDNGRLTTLSLVEKNAYTLELEEPSVDKIGEDTAL